MRFPALFSFFHLSNSSSLQQTVYYYTFLTLRKKVVFKEEENAPSKFFSQFPLYLRAFIYKSIASYEKTKIPLNLRRKTVSQILSRSD